MNPDKSLHEKNIKIERRILNFSLFSCLALAAGELIVGLILNAHSVVTVAIVDAMDSLLTIPFIFLVPKLYKPATEKKPYGYTQLESLFLMIEYCIQIFVLLSMIKENIELLFEGGNEVNAFGVAMLQIGCTIACVLIYAFIAHNAKKYESPVIKLEVLLWKIAVLSTAGVACAFILQMLIEGTSIAFIAPYMDPAVALIIAIILIRTPITNLVNSIRNLLLFAPPEETMDELRNVINEKLEGSQYSLAFLDVIETGRTLWIEIFMYAKNGIFSTSELDELRNAITEELQKKDYENVHVEMAAELDNIQ